MSVHREGTYLPADGGGGTYLPADGEGVPNFLLTGAVPTMDRDVPTLGRTPSFGKVPPFKVGLPQETEQHSEYLLRGGQYASCVHAGGLSCLKVYHFALNRCAIGINTVGSNKLYLSALFVKVYLRHQHLP